VLSAGVGDCLSVPEEFLWIHTRVFDDLAEQEGGDVASAMDGNGSFAAVRMPKLLVGTALPHSCESHPLKDRDHLSRSQARQRAHGLRRDRLDSHELGLELGLPVLQKHGQDLFEVPVQLVQGSALGMRPGESGHVADIQSSVWVPFNDGCVGPHQSSSARPSPVADHTPPTSSRARETQALGRWPITFRGL